VGDPDLSAGELAERVRSQGWYHTLELAPGVVTEGMFDLRRYVSRYGLPERMDGMRALDGGTWDGFWAFEIERRGAEVVALTSL
jgi:tRNA (mo5U34)-methyltransferase